MLGSEEVLALLHFDEERGTSRDCGTGLAVFGRPLPRSGRRANAAFQTFILETR